MYINNDRSKPIEVFCDMDTDGGGWLVGFIDQLYRIPEYNICLPIMSMSVFMIIMRTNYLYEIFLIFLSLVLFKWLRSRF